MPSEAATLGSDYSGHTIYLGCLKNGLVASVASLDMTHAKAGVDNLREVLIKYKEDFNINKIWAEEAWVNGARFPRSGLMLARTAAFLEIAAADTELQIEFIHPLTWRKAVYSHARPANPKEVARAYVKELFGYETKFKKDHNIAEAILLAHYGALRA